MKKKSKNRRIGTFAVTSVLALCLALGGLLSLSACGGPSGKELKLEAEKAILEGTPQGGDFVVESEDEEGTSGWEYVGNLANAGNSVTWVFESEEATSFDITFKLANPLTGEMDLASCIGVSVNGEDKTVSAKLAAKGAEGWTDVKVRADNIQEGYNFVKLTVKQNSAGAGGTVAAPNVDCIVMYSDAITAHSHKWTTTQTGGCVEEGVTHTTCSSCKYSYDVAGAPANGHTVGEDGKCEVCGELVYVYEAEYADMSGITSGYGATIDASSTASNGHSAGSFSVEGNTLVFNIGFPGSHGLIGLANVIKGTVSPSGRLSDTYAYDSTSAPSYAETNVDNCTTGVYEYGNRGGYYYVDYNEGIYLGYRYYETRYADGSSSKDPSKDYDEVVQYPFGYGLSYTEFSWEVLSASPAAGSSVDETDTVSIRVKVTNMGDVAGKEVVQCYYTAPYTPGGIEKSYVVLCAFAKTDLIQPGDSETVTLEFDVEDLASYDCYNLNGDDHTGYTLDEGIYNVRIMKNSHDLGGAASEFVIDYNIGSTINLTKRSHDLTDVHNLFTGDEAENGIPIDGSRESQTVTYLSRSDWEGTWPKKSVSRNMTQAVIDSLSYSVVNDENDEMPVTGAENGLVLDDLSGCAYDDEKWELLLDQLTVSDMVKLVSQAGYSTVRIASIEKKKTIDLDGPAGINESNTKIGTSTEHAVAYPCEVVVAQTWSEALAYDMGYALGNEANAYGINGWYAPAVNLHRSPYSGRNFEYYSEDPFLSGKMGAGVVDGTNSMGLYAYVKHFAVNDQETRRDANGLFTWVTEQAVRELYLPPFEATVKEGGAIAFMSSFNRIGSTWTGGSYALLTQILRKEWGFEGMVITDWYYPGNYMNIDQGLRAGNDAWLNGLGLDVSFDSKSATSVLALRNASHNILYALSNSTIESQEVQPLWAIGVVVADVVVLAGLAVWLFFVIRGMKRNAKEMTTGEGNA